MDGERAHLAAIKGRAQQELQALEFTDRIEHARAELAALKQRRRSGERIDEVTEERIERLERLVQEASIRGARNITGMRGELDLGAGP